MLKTIQLKKRPNHTNGRIGFCAIVLYRIVFLDGGLNGASDWLPASLVSKFYF